MAGNATRTILVVDDEPLILEMCKEALQDAGYAVLTAPSASAALALMRAQRVDAVLLDIIMPDKDGLETLLEIKRADPTLAVYVMSGGGRAKRNDFLQAAVKFGADGALKKPFSPSEMLMLLEARRKMPCLHF
jgi:DNA-binding response OmpR family regulator